MGHLKDQTQGEKLGEINNKVQRKGWDQTPLLSLTTMKHYIERQRRE